MRKTSFNVLQFQAIPIIRIFDEAKARAFYLKFLGMALDYHAPRRLSRSTLSGVRLLLGQQIRT
ncbi:glyoxalase superfamily protein [Zhongshania borealis]|uniref:glyoxalase superfamily protein n=1 Tax=Zhongshania borealis TaxID=889488 RepID=UPI003CD06BFC